MADHRLIREIDQTTDRWRILVRVDRKWPIYPKSSPNELFAISIVFVDEMGSKIQAIVKHKSLHRKWLDTAIEGRVYFIANFAVEENDGAFKPTTHPFRLQFSSSTHIQEEEESLPEHVYNFVLLSDILNFKKKEDIPHLVDVMAFVKEIGELEEYSRDETKKTKLRLLLTDNKNCDVDCVLWDECSEEAYSSYLRNSKPPVVIVLSYARIGFSEDGVAQVHNSYNATRVEFNLKIKEVMKFIKSNCDGKSPIVSPLSMPFPSRYHRQTSSASLTSEARIPISEVVNQLKGNAFVICGEFQKLETIHNWVYDGCSKCSGKIKDDEGELKCPLCKKVPTAVELKLKLHYTVTDDTGNASIVFWDKEAIQLVHKTATQLKYMLKEKNRDYDIPDELEEVAGKRAIIKLRKNKYNMDHPNSSISVVQFIMCDDLLGEFDEAASGGDDDDHGPVAKKYGRRSIVKKKEGTQSSAASPDSEPITLLDDDEDDDTPLAQLSKNDNRQKGKKKVVTKRSTEAGSSKEAVESPVKAKAEKRLRKVKKE